MSQLVEGARVLIVRGDHPWHGHAGTIVKAETWLGEPSFAVELDTGFRAGCRAEDLELVRERRRRRRP